MDYSASYAGKCKRRKKIKVNVNKKHTVAQTVMGTMHVTHLYF